MHPPKIFISATSGDLRSVRQIVKEALLTINCHPVEQTNFEPDARTVETMLRGKISGCQALIHICGKRYGAEPDLATLPPGTPRRSYTQWEYHIGRQLQDERGDDHFRVYTFICPDDFPYDEEPDVEPQEKRDLQNAHRSRLFDSPHLREKPKDAQEIHLRVLALQEQVITLQQDITTATEHIDQWGGELSQGLKELTAAQQITAARIRAHLQEVSETKLTSDLAAADRATLSSERETLREAAHSAHHSRLSRADDLAASFARAEADDDSSPVLREMTSILTEEGVEQALAYVTRQRPSLLEQIHRRADALHRQNREDLQPLLKAAALSEAKGDSTAARASYQEILTLEPDWPEVIDAFAWFLFDASTQSREHGSQRDALADAETMFTLATRLQSLALEEPLPLRLLSVACNQVAEVLILRGQPGDAEQALAHFQRYNEISEKLLIANPDSAQAARDVSVSLNKLGDFLASRGQPGDAEKALAHFQRSLEVREKLLTANPDSAQAARDVSISLEQLGNFLARRGQPGDAEQALAHFQRSLEICEKLLTANPDSAEAARDVWVSCWKLAALAERTGIGNAAAWWRRAYDILQGMVDKGMFLTPEDKGFLETLRGKVGGK